MKKLFFTCMLLIAARIGFAQDLTYTVINTTIGFSTGSIDLSVSGGVAPFTFSWTGPSGFTATTEDIAALANGNYTVTVTDKFCGIATITVFVDNDLASSINENTLNAVSVFPNPANSLVTLTSGMPLQNASLKILNVSGQVVFTSNGISGNTFSFDATSLSKGIYFIEITEQGISSRTRFVKN